MPGFTPIFCNPEAIAELSASNCSNVTLQNDPSRIGSATAIAPGRARAISHKCAATFSVVDFAIVIDSVMVDIVSGGQTIDEITRRSIIKTDFWHPIESNYHPAICSAPQLSGAAIFAIPSYNKAYGFNDLRRRANSCLA